MTGEKDPRDVMQAEHDARLSEHPAFQAPAEMPGVEEIARAIASWRHRSTPANPYRPSILPSEMAQASAVIALFAPTLAEKQKPTVALNHWKSRALAAEAALAAERERCAGIVEDWAEQHAAGLDEDASSPLGRHRVAMNDGYALAAAIRAQGE